MRSRIWWLVLAAIAAGCAEPSGGAPERARVSFDVRSLATDIVSVLASARLTIESGGGSTTQTLALSGSDSVIAFEVELKDGPARFLLDVVSNNQTVLYHADQNATIDRDDFTVALTPVAVAPILVVSPRNPLFVLFNLGSERLGLGVIRVKNAGIGQLRYRLEKAAPDSVRTCGIGAVPPVRDCFLQQILDADFNDPRRIEDTLGLSFNRPPGVPGGNRTISIVSNVGTATFTFPVP